MNWLRPQDFAVLAAILAALGNSAADELARLQSEYLEKRREIVRPLTLEYAEKLKAVHESLVRRGELARARSVQDERQRVLASEAVGHPVATVVAPQAPGATSAAAPSDTPELTQAFLLPEEAQLILRGQKLSRGNLAVHFNQRGAAAEWKLPRLRPGRYRITMTYGCLAPNGGVYQLVMDGHPPFRLVAEPTNPEGASIEVDLGEWELAASPSSLRLEVLELTGKSRQLMTLSDIRLRRIPPTSPAPGPTPPAEGNAR